MNLLKNEVLILLMSMVPVSELRGAIPYGLATGVPALRVFILSVTGNLLIIPVVLLSVEWLFLHLKRLELFRKHIERYESRTASKIHHYREYRLLGLFLLVALPLPGTGAYTGCVAARIMKMRFRNSWFAISMGVIVSGVVVLTMSLGIIHLGSV